MTPEPERRKAASQPTSPEELLARAVALGPALRDRALACERLRRVPEDTMADFSAAGFFDMLKPRRYGGAELDPLAFLNVCIEIARHCGSSAWVLAILGVHNWRLALFPDQAAAEVWSSGLERSPLIAASTPPTGTVARVKGGYRISGRWPFSSGVDHCGWAFLAVKVPAGSEGRVAFQYLFLVPRSDFAIDDTWHVAGLKGTGTNTIVIRDAFVPDHRASSEADTARLRRDPACSNAGGLYRYPWGLMLAWAIAAPAIGMAAAAHRHHVDFVRAKGAGVGADAPGNSHAPLLIANNETMLACLEARLREDFAALAATIGRGEEPPIALRARCRWEASWSVERAAEITRTVFEAMGAGVIFEEHPVQRLFRDVHALKAHRINNAAATGENFGGLQVGMPNREVFL
jgi:3-hydroxy-9,10-secoandrosta-1,3,5(10)-triene-9,17-dione monooxygenase